VDAQVLPVEEASAANGVGCRKCRKLAEMVHEIEDGRRLITDDNLLEMLPA
jgi:2-dehydropantoate 2-reductase